MTTGQFRPSPIPPTPIIEMGVPGSRGELGLVLWANGDETVAWDLEQEVVTARRRWLADREGWWVDLSYYETVVEIVLRSFASVQVVNRRAGDLLISRDGVAAIQERLL